MKGYDPYKKLVVSIVGRALGDYKKASIQLEQNPNYKVAIKSKEEIEIFFKSDWFNFLCKINTNIEKLISKENMFHDN